MPQLIEKHIYFVRHGQSIDNTREKPVLQGPDDPLSEFGKEQAQFVADRLTSVHAEIIFSSPMPRARDTAQIIHEATSLPLVQSELFREYRPPRKLIGRPKDDPESQVFLHAQREHMHDPSWHYADEDNYHDLHEQAVKMLDFLISRPEKEIIVVTHAGILRVLITAMMTEGEPDATLTFRFMRFLKPQNTGITLCRYRADAERRNKWRLLVWNDHAHLADTPLAEPIEQEDWEAEPGAI